MRLPISPHPQKRPRILPEIILSRFVYHNRTHQRGRGDDVRSNSLRLPHDDGDARDRRNRILLLHDDVRSSSLRLRHGGDGGRVRRSRILPHDGDAYARRSNIRLHDAAKEQE